MRRNPLALAAVCALATLLSGAQVAAAGGRLLGARGDLLVTFSGSGGGSYHFHQPAQGLGPGCRAGDATYTETDSYDWSFTFVVPPTGGSSIAPAAMTGSGLLSSSEQTRRCGGGSTTTTCTQLLKPPTPDDAADLAYPGVNVVASARQITVGVLGELLRAGDQPTCSGDGSLIGNVVRGYSELQASVTFPRAVLSRPGGFSGAFTMSGAGLYAGVPLSGSCNSTTCDASTCAQDEPASGGGSPSTCGFGEAYSGAIEVRVVR